MAPTNHHSHLFWNQFSQTLLNRSRHFICTRITARRRRQNLEAGISWQSSRKATAYQNHMRKMHRFEVRGSRLAKSSKLCSLLLKPREYSLSSRISVIFILSSSEDSAVSEFPWLKITRDASYWLHWWCTEIFSSENRISLQFHSSYPGNVTTQKHNHLGSYRSQKHPCLELPETRRQLLNQSRKFLIPWNRKTDYSLNEREQQLTQYATRNGICKRNKQHISNITKKLQDASCSPPGLQFGISAISATL